MKNLQNEIYYWAHMLDEAFSKDIDEATGNEPEPDYGENTLDNIEIGDSVDKNFEQALKVLGDDNYEAFIQDINSLTKIDNEGKIAKLRDALIKLFNDPKHKKAMKVLTGTLDLPIMKVRPTQSEVDMEKSLKFPLNKNPEAAKVFFGKDPVMIKKPIVVAKVNNSFYVIDGHHRWSQVYCMNPHAVMKALVIESKNLFDTPDDVLKFV